MDLSIGTSSFISMCRWSGFLFKHLFLSDSSTFIRKCQLGLWVKELLKHMALHLTGKTELLHSRYLSVNIIFNSLPFNTYEKLSWEKQYLQKIARRTCSLSIHPPTFKSHGNAFTKLWSGILHKLMLSDIRRNRSLKLTMFTKRLLLTILHCITQFSLYEGPQEKFLSHVIPAITVFSFARGLFMST